MKVKKRTIIGVMFFLILALVVFVQADSTPIADWDFQTVFNIKNVSNISAAFYCNATATACYQVDEFLASGSGDITAVNTNGAYLSGGATSGAVSLFLNETFLNATIDDRAGTGSIPLNGTTTNLTVQNLNPLDSNKVDVWGNLTLFDTITFRLGEMIDNLVDGWVRVTGNLNVTENVTANYFLGNGSQLTDLTESQIVDLAHVGTDGITLQLLNITGVDDNACSGTDKISNVTFDNGAILITCTSDVSAGSPTPNSTTIAYQNVTNWPTCGGTDKLTYNGTDIICATDQTAAGGTDGTGGWTNDSIQTNTSLNVNIQNGANLTTNKLFAEDWTNATITEAQVSDLSHTTDTNATTACATDEVLDGDGDCVDHTQWITSAVQNNTGGWNLSFSTILSDDWSNISGLVDSQISDSITLDSGSTVDKGALANAGTLVFDWVDSEIADAISIIGGILGANSVSGLWTTTGTWTLGDGGDRIDVSSDTWDVTNGVISGSSIASTQLTDGGAIGFDWVDAEIADTLTIGASSTVADGALSSNVVLLNANNVFTGQNNFSNNSTFTNDTRTFYGDENQGEIYWDSVNQRLVIKVS